MEPRGSSPRSQQPVICPYHQLEKPRQRPPTPPRSYVLNTRFNPLNAELNPIRHLLALLGARHILHVSRIRVNIIHPSTPMSPKWSLSLTYSHHNPLTLNRDT